jgi:hypothetical protein
MDKNIISFAIVITIILQLSQQKTTQRSIRQSIDKTYSGCNQRIYLGQPISFDNYITDSHLKPTTSKIMFH